MSFQGEVWGQLSLDVQRAIVAQQVRVWVIDASRVAREAGMGTRTNTIMRTCFFAISGVLPRDEAIARIRRSIENSYASKGAEVVQRLVQQAPCTGDSWPLARFDPLARASGGSPFVLDSPEPTIPFREYAYQENRYRALTQQNPHEAARLLVLAQEPVTARWRIYVEMATHGT